MMTALADYLGSCEVRSEEGACCPPLVATARSEEGAYCPPLLATARSGRQRRWQGRWHELLLRVWFGDEVFEREASCTSSIFS